MQTSARGAWAAQQEAGVGLAGRCANGIRAVIGATVVWLAHYLWVQWELHLRRALPRREHYIVMRFFRLWRRPFPVTIDYPNPVCRDGRRLVMTFDLRDNHAVFFRERERYEREWLRLIAAAMRDAGCFVDVGAHVGMFALAVAQAYPDRRVIALEPHPTNFDRLALNIRLNQLHNVEAIQAAVADAVGPLPLFMNPLQDGGGSLKSFAAYRTGDVAVDARTYRLRHRRFQEAVPVPTRRLDELIRAPSVVKIDVEGAEAWVLRSGRQAFEAGLIEAAVVEIDQDAVDEVAAFLDAVGCEGFRLGRRLPLRPGERLRYRIENILVVRRGSALHRSLDFA